MEFEYIEIYKKFPDSVNSYQIGSVQENSRVSLLEKEEKLIKKLMDGGNKLFNVIIR
jgi:hypothetical protein